MRSRYFRFFEKDGVVAIFHALKPIPIFLSLEDWEEFCQSDGDKELKDWLCEQHLLVETFREDDEARDAIAMEIIDRKSVSILYLVLTKACTFRCRQCFQYERHREDFPDLRPNLSMSEEIAYLGIDTFVRHIRESDDDGSDRQIYFYGGEPLLNWDIFKKSICYVEGLQRKGDLPDLSLSVITNGSLINEEKAKFLADHGIAVGLSIDGPREKNDVYRMYSDGSGTFDDIMNALETLRRYDVDVMLSITVNPNIVLNLSEIVLWAKKEMGVSSISFNLVGGNSYRYTLQEMSMDAYNRALAEGLVNAYNLARKIGVYEDRVARKVDDFSDHVFRSVDCGAVGNQLVVQPDGSIAFYHASDAYNIGSVYDPKFRIFEHPVIREWEKTLPLFNPRCQDCPAIAICGYGCFHHVLELGKPLEEGDEQFCLHTKAVMEYLIWKLQEYTS